MKIIILGYSGLIGNSILKNLIKTTSHEIICVGRDIKNKPYKEKRVKYFKWDFISFKKLSAMEKPIWHLWSSMHLPQKMGL